MEEHTIIPIESSMAQIEYVESGYSRCICINDTRVTAGKLYGFGYTVSCCHVNKDRLRKLIEGKDIVEILPVKFGWKGFWIDGVNISTKGKRSDYEEQLKRINILRKKCSKDYHPKLQRELNEISPWRVETEDIRNALNSSYHYLKRK